MKKIFILSSLFMLSFTQVKACDICGCGVGNFNPHMFPHLSKNFIGLSYQHYYYRTHFTENGIEMNNRESYTTYMATVQYSPVKNWQVMVMLPFQVNRQVGEEGNKSLNKPGDILLLVNYKLLDIMGGKNNSTLRHTLLAGIGIKLPTGGYSFDEANETHVANSNFQAGTGSTDYLLNSFYSFRYKKMGFSTGVTYKINTENRSGYHFGNKFLNVTQVKYIKDIGRLSLIPSIGVMSEKRQEDRQDGVKVEENHTGGYNIQGLAGLDLNSKKLAIGFTYAASISQNLAGGHIKAEPGINVHVSYSF